MCRKVAEAAAGSHGAQLPLILADTSALEELARMAEQADAQLRLQEQMQKQVGRKYLSI